MVSTSLRVWFTSVATTYGHPTGRGESTYGEAVTKRPAIVSLAKPYVKVNTNVWGGGNQMRAYYIYRETKPSCYVLVFGGGAVQRPPRVCHRRPRARRSLAAARSWRRWCSSWQPWRPQVLALGERASRDRAIIFPQTEHGLLIAHLTSMLTDTSTPGGASIRKEAVSASTALTTAATVRQGSHPHPGAWGLQALSSE